MCTHLCCRRKPPWLFSISETAPGPGWRSWATSNLGTSWRRRCPCCPWGGASIAPGHAAPPARCRWTAQRLTTSYATGRRSRPRPATAGHRLPGEQEGEKKVMSRRTDLRNDPSHWDEPPAHLSLMPRSCRRYWSAGCHTWASCSAAMSCFCWCCWRRTWRQAPRHWPVKQAHLFARRYHLTTSKKMRTPLKKKMLGED